MDGKHVFVVALLLSLALYVNAGTKYSPSSKTVCNQVSTTTESCSNECLDWDTFLNGSVYCLAGYGTVCRNNTVTTQKCSREQYSDIKYELKGVQGVQDGKPIWGEINNTVSHSGEAGYNYGLDNGLYQLHFKSDPTEGQVVYYTHNNLEFYFQPMALKYRNDLSQLQQIKMIDSVVGTADGNRIIYPDAYGSGVDLVYSMGNEVVKENLEVSNTSALTPPEQYILEGGNPTLDLDFIISTDHRIIVDGVEWDKKNTATSTQDVLIQDAEGNTEYVLKTPTASNQDGDTIQGSYTFKNSGNSLYVTISVNQTWVNQSKTINLDPTIQIYSDNVFITNDATVVGVDGKKDMNYDEVLRLSGSSEVDWFDDNQSYYMTINLSNFADIDNINYADMIIQTGATHAYAFTVDLHEVYNTSWSEKTVTFNNQPCGTGFDDSTNCNLTKSTSDYLTTFRDIKMNISEIFKRKVNEGNKTIGLYYRIAYPDTSRFSSYTSEYSTVSDRPYLNISYNTTTNTYNITSCTTMDDKQGVYNLIQDISGSSIGGCMDITVEGVTLKCMGNTIDGDGTADYGIRVQAENATIYNCTVTDWDTAGIYTTSDYTNITESNISSNPDSGVWFSDSQHGFMKNNEITGNSGTYEVQYTDDAGDDCDATFINNRGEDGNAILHYNETVTLANMNNISSITLCNADNSRITNITASKPGTGGAFLHLTGTSDGTHIENNTITGCYYGMAGYHSENLLFKNNVVNESFTGILAYGSLKPSIYKNNLSHNSYAGLYMYQSDNHSINESDVRENKYGYLNYDSDYGSVYENTFTNHSTYSLWITVGDTGVSNTFYNNIFNQSGVSYMLGLPGNNNLNTSLQDGVRHYKSGNKIGGNAYINFTGGYSTTCTDANFDGFCDNNITLNSIETDYLPLSDEYKVFPDNVSIQPSPVVGSNQLNCTYDKHVHGQTVTSNYTSWFKDGVMQTDLNDSMTVASSNTSVDDEWYCNLSIEVDGEENSTWYDSNTVTIGDRTPPYNSTPASFTNTNPTTSQECIVTINVSDASSLVDTVLLDTTTPSGTLNYTMVCGSGGSVLCNYTLSGFSNTVTVNEIHFSDSSGNWGNTTGISQAITFHTIDAGGGGGGGAGSEPGEVSIYPQLFNESIEEARLTHREEKTYQAILEAGDAGSYDLTFRGETYTYDDGTELNASQFIYYSPKEISLSGSERASFIIGCNITPEKYLVEPFGVYEGFVGLLDEEVFVNCTAEAYRGTPAGLKTVLDESSLLGFTGLEWLAGLFLVVVALVIQGDSLPKPRRPRGIYPWD